MANYLEFNQLHKANGGIVSGYSKSVEWNLHVTHMTWQLARDQR